MAELSTEAQLAVLARDMRSMVDLFETHTTQDMEQLNKLDGKLDQMLLRVISIQVEAAKETGERVGRDASLKRTSGVISTVISVVISIVGILAAIHWG